MANQYLMAVDAGTGSVRAVLFDLDGNQVGCVQKEWDHKEDPRFPGRHLLRGQRCQQHLDDQVQAF